MTNHQLYLEWLNHWYTVAAFADYVGLSESAALEAIDIGRKEHEAQFIAFT